jgi:hypothetical protein
MPHFPYSLGRVFIRPYRNGHTWAVYGATAAGLTRYHSRLEVYRHCYSRDEAARRVTADITSGHWFFGQTIANGHHAGSEERRCNMGCDRGVTSSEFFPVLPVIHHTAPSPVPAANYTTRRPRRRATPAFDPNVNPNDGMPFFPRDPPANTRIAAGILSIGVELEGEVGYAEYDSDQYDDPNDDPDYSPDEHGLYRISEWAGRHCPRMTDNHEGYAAQGDGSVESQNGGSTGEFTFWSTSFEEIERWLKVMYQEFGVEPNNSCGFHIHVKADPQFVPLFASSGYWTQFQKAYMEFAERQPARHLRQKYEERAESRWCRFEEWEPRTVIQRFVQNNGDRYRAINLLSIHGHDGRRGWGTIEHRIMPYQATAEEAIQSLRWFVDTVSGLLTGPLEAVPPMKIEPPTLFSEEGLSFTIQDRSAVPLDYVGTVIDHSEADGHIQTIIDHSEDVPSTTDLLMEVS